MTRLFDCQYFGVTVELSGEREAHITASHPGTLPDYLEQLADTLETPDLVRSSDRDPTPYYSPSGLTRFVPGATWWL
ncbi:hypothetical protein [Phormidium tenue]|uniref:hypothetical protein n=1 Tax=Phormidium tenue TaxID=126344 RepID=UPI0018EFF901|nr:hypothetical protein [Phormidium tenue]